MGAFVVASPAVTWTGSPVADSKITWNQASVNATGTGLTYLDATNVQNAIAGTRTWTAALNGFLGTVNNGTALAITYSTGYATMVENWSAAITCRAETYHTDESTGRWMDALPSTVGWTINYQCKVDDADPMIVPGADATPAEIECAIDGSNTLTGDVVSTTVGPQFNVGSIAMVTVSVQGSGALTAAGSNNIIAAGDIAAMTPSTLTIKGHEVGTTDVQCSGTAFWTALNLNVSSGLVTYGINAQGSGALTITDPAA